MAVEIPPPSNGKLDNTSICYANTTKELSHNTRQNEINYERSGPHHRYIVLKTICLVFSWITMGMVASITGPTTPDMRDRLGVDMETISVVFGFRNIGTPVGCVISGMICDRYRSGSDMIGGLSLLLLGSCSIVRPHIYSMPLLAIVCFFEGYGHGGIDAAGHAMIPWMWHDRAASPMNAIHLGFPIGSALAPLIAMNFLKPQAESDETTTSMETSTVVYEQRIVHNDTRLEYGADDEKDLAFWNESSVSYTDMTTADPEEVVSLIEIPYGITGGSALLMASLLLALFAYGKLNNISLYGKSKTSLKEAFDPKSFRGTGNTCFTVSILVLVCLFLGFCNSGSASIGPFIFSFATESDLQFTNEEASLLETTYKSVAIFSRLVCTILSRWVPVQLMLGVSAILCASFAACLAFFAPDGKVYLWVFMCLFECFRYPLWPAAMIWSGKYITYSSLVVGFVQICSSLMSFFAQWVSGYMYDNFAQGVFMFLGMGLIVMMLLVWVVMQVLASCQVARNKSRTRQEAWAEEVKQYSSNINIYTENTNL